MATSEGESQFVLVTHGTHDNSSSNDSNLNKKLLRNKSNDTLEEAENESDSDNKEEIKQSTELI